MPASEVFHIVANALFGDQYKNYFRENGAAELAGVIKPVPGSGFDRRITGEQENVLRIYFGDNASRFQKALEYVRVSPDSTRKEWREMVLNAVIHGNLANGNGDPISPPNEESSEILLNMLLPLAINHHIND